MTFEDPCALIERLHPPCRSMSCFCQRMHRSNLMAQRILIIEKTWLQTWNFKMKFQYDFPPLKFHFSEGRAGMVFMLSSLVREYLKLPLLSVSIPVNQILGLFADICGKPCFLTSVWTLSIGNWSYSIRFWPYWIQLFFNIFNWSYWKLHQLENPWFLTSKFNRDVMV